ncbi:MAG: diacylglycerol/lipid kinase family protein [Candidatus Promineifilaceae bacterium]
MRIRVILNPYANRWRAGRMAGAVQAAFAQAGLPVELLETAAPGAGAGLAQAAAAAGYDAVVAAGGDGTLHEVVNGLLTAAGPGPSRPLGILPLGTGNDFSDTSGLPRDLAAAVALIAAGHTRQVDAGRVTADGVAHFFHNNCAVAMEPLVTLENIRMTRLSGNARYLVALVKGLLKLRAWDMRIQWDGGGYEGPTYLLSVCNGPRTGGLFPMAPPARNDDGQFHYVFAPKVPPLSVLAILARLLRGAHLNHPRVRHGRTARIALSSSPGTPVHADGELIADSAAEVTYQILPGKLTLLCRPGERPG